MMFVCLFVYRADAPIYSHTFEDAVVEDMLHMGYTPEGHTNGESTRVLKAPQRLQWEIPSEVGLCCRWTSLLSI